MQQPIDRLSEAIKLAPEPINIVRVVTTRSNDGKQGAFGVAVYRLDLGTKLQPIARWREFVSGPTQHYERATEDAREYARRRKAHYHFSGRAFGAIDASIADALLNTIAQQPEVR
jgi:hypothetical protein